MADVSEEVARAELQRWFDAMDIDIEDDELDQEDEEDLKLLVKNVMSGRLLIDAEGQPVYTPKLSNDGQAITFHEPTGASWMAMDKGVSRRRQNQKQQTEEQRFAKLFRAMADMTQTSVATFSNMKNRDLTVCMTIANIFLAG